ncbi:valine--pyruvate transaminase [Litoribrevibacter albus]|uniref:Valine--pyruvate transaminase n=1 Tax=Litoribrevibacter albus TaxID=1473156 RepID=A0AA37W899_9GAMM|nr:valine--pyruvate transaminase [Litoribrevibacter albus]GLQ33627.1 valine--pyruvate transaminase [Litoribrevibacter albus]
MKFSAFGKKFTSESGILNLMEDLGNALANPDSRNMIMMGGGNPAHIPEIEDIIRQRLIDISQDTHELQQFIGVYDTPQGEKAFRQSLASLLSKEFGWPLTEDHIALTNGSQSAFFMLFNLLAGEQEQGSRKHILFPMAPEYIGYADAGLSKDCFKACKPEIELIGEHQFKYRVDFDALSINEDTAAICVSRPTNPTGNVVTDEEVQRLDELAKQHQIPLIIDGAYGTPFPDIIFSEATPIWNDNIILCLSLSKFGLPAARTGIVIAKPEIVQAISNVNAILSLATNSIGARLALPLVESGDILKLSREVIKPFYQARCDLAIKQLESDLSGLPVRVHKPEGAMFLWLWCKDLPIDSQAFYERLKEKGLIVVPGHYFFPGMENEDWAHKNECIRINYSQSPEHVQQGLTLICDELKALYKA